MLEKEEETLLELSRDTTNLSNRLMKNTSSLKED